MMSNITQKANETIKSNTKGGVKKDFFKCFKPYLINDMKEQEFSFAVNLLVDVKSLLNASLNEIAGQLTKNELWAVVDMLNGTCMEHIGIHDNLIKSQIEDSCHYDCLDTKWGIDKKVLTEKMLGFNKIQRYALFNWIHYLWSQGILDETLEEMINGKPYIVNYVPLQLY